MGDGCLDYLQFVERRQQTGRFARVASGVASICLSMLRRDLDGVLTLDPLGDRMIEISRVINQASAEGLADRVGPARDVVRQQLADATRLNHTKLVSRNAQLLKYFDDRTRYWN